MERILIAGLIATNLVTGLTAFHYYDMHKFETSDRTSDEDRDTYGKGCVEWFQSMLKEKGMADDAVYLGRSWKKHGQMVFEINPSDDFDHEKWLPAIGGVEWPGALCTYDAQSGMMHAIEGSEKKTWMFY